MLIAQHASSTQFHQNTEQIAENFHIFFVLRSYVFGQKVVRMYTIIIDLSFGKSF